MNKDLHLRLQSYLDGELSDRERRRVEAWLSQDADARAWRAELAMAKGFLHGNEPEKQVPDTREFYWSKIRREIERTEKAASASSQSPWFVWRKYLVPVAGVALVTLMAVSTIRLNTVPSIDPYVSHLAEIENLSEHSGSFSFRSQAENMFVVWVYDRTEEPNSEPELMNETAVQ